MMNSYDVPKGSYYVATGSHDAASPNESSSADARDECDGPTGEKYWPRGATNGDVMACSTYALHVPRHA